MSAPIVKCPTCGNKPEPKQYIYWWCATCKLYVDPEVEAGGK